MVVTSIFRCLGCNAYICIDEYTVSKNGKHIPLNATGKDRYLPHKCPANPFRRIHYHLKQMPRHYAEEGKVRRYDRVRGPTVTYETPRGEYRHTNRYEWQCTWCNEVYEYRIKAMKCCTDEEYD